jgi:hypothetical protein
MLLRAFQRPTGKIECFTTRYESLTDLDKARPRSVSAFSLDLGLLESLEILGGSPWEPLSRPDASVGGASSRFVRETGIFQSHGFPHRTDGGPCVASGPV